MSYTLVAALMAKMISVVSWHVLAPVREQSAPRSGSAVEAQATPKPANISTIPVRGAPSHLATARPPVPVLLTRRPPIASVSSTSWEEVVPQYNSVAPPSNFNDEKAATASFERDGYKGVHALSRGADGMWNACALRGQTDVAVSVDLAGNVTAN
jgi:hypothetical protein